VPRAPRSTLIALLCAVAGFAAGCGGDDRASLISAPAVIGTTPVLLRATSVLPAHNPINQVTFCLDSAAGYLYLVRAGEPRGWNATPDSVRIVMHATLVMADGTRRPLSSEIMTGGCRHRLPITFTEVESSAPGDRAIGVEAWANVPVRVDSANWWSYDPKKVFWLSNFIP
jgi:hypothetical protein